MCCAHNICISYCSNDPPDCTFINVSNTTVVPVTIEIANIFTPHNLLYGKHISVTDPDHRKRIPVPDRTLDAAQNLLHVQVLGITIHNLTTFLSNFELFEVQCMQFLPDCASCCPTRVVASTITIRTSATPRS